jgi:hypothetical protein
MNLHHIVTDTQYTSLKTAKEAFGILGLNADNATDHGFAVTTQDTAPDLTSTEKVVLSDKPTVNQDGSWSYKWSVIDKTAEEIALELARSRERMICSPLQGILTLGETEWGKILTYRDAKDEEGNPITPWEQRVMIDSALDWHRTSQNISFFGYLLNYTDEQMDVLFTAAMLEKR